MNLSESRNDALGVESLMHMEDLLGRLHDVLDKELQAVARFDLEAMARIDCDKRELVVELEGVTDNDRALPKVRLDADDQKIREEEKARVEEAVSFALRAPDPEPIEAFRDIFAGGP